ncbi:MULTISPECIES: hypothetical protein [Paenibacillus]|uniref:Uncharacterized protein n=1 Tax=Paenibacillus xylanexedens TaxID=528191 RepID=A0ABS4RN39_PAEXY|nr:hypothetical protein [Paenibacillus xylanexedens]MBP2243836.1 hypothetical protein [Paenibacillus xylanexedens]
MKLYETFIFDDATPLICIGIDEQEGMAVLAPFYADDEDCLPELHVEDGVMVFNLLATYKTLKPLNMKSNVTRIVVE